jgi:deoxyhypusine synthase
MNYKITCERFEAKKVNDIINKMKELLIFDCQQLKKTKKIIESQINKHRQNVIYEVND